WTGAVSLPVPFLGGGHAHGGGGVPVRLAPICGPVPLPAVRGGGTHPHGGGGGVVVLPFGAPVRFAADPVPFGHGGNA
ncbi:MAG: hypothetical protein ACREBT_07195, partial [Thermoplasmata archaeon]